MTNSAFLGTFANLSGYSVAGFFVDGLVARDTAGAPVWRVVCRRCGDSQPIQHSKLAPLVQGRRTQHSLQCANAGCELSRQQHKSDTMAEFRRRERSEQEEAAKSAAEAQRTAEAQAAKEREIALRNQEIQRQYLAYLNHQWRARQSDDNICTRDRFFQLTDGTRQRVRDLIAKDPHVRIKGL